MTNFITLSSKPKPQTLHPEPFGIAFDQQVGDPTEIALTSDSASAERLRSQFRVSSVESTSRPTSQIWDCGRGFRSESFVYGLQVSTAATFEAGNSMGARILSNIPL